MAVDHTEKGFENAIETHLVKYGGYHKGDPSNFNRELAMDTVTLFKFIQESQPKQWEKLRKIHGANVKEKFLNRLNKELNQRGMLDCLRHGITDYGVKFTLMFPLPASQLNPEAIHNYNLNHLTVTRQVKYSTKNENSLDMVISVNGLPTATLELKNPLTNQNVSHAKRQYCLDRDPKELIFQFKKRALVHFAVDTELVYMTTRLAGKKTFFLPFNKGRNNGAGNPDNPNGYNTAYLWEEILVKDSWIDILSRFMHLQVKEEEEQGKKVRKETMIFPRYHQLDVVRKLESDTRARGTGKNYLIQHSAGSGKSNSIAWLAHRLANLHDEQDKPVFDSVIVITDRRVLDKQLQDTIYQFEHKQGVVEKIDRDSTQLANALMKGIRIIITTLQKFPFIMDKVDSLKGNKFAIIVDEAHSSQTGESAKALKEVLTLKSLEEAAKAETEQEDSVDPEEEILKTMKAHGRQPNLSFYAFTATPKHKTLEMFGEPRENGKPEPFHLYSMRQAIEEGFILDVLKNYMTYKTFYRLSKQIEDDPHVNKKKATRAISRFVSLHPHNIAQKAEVMIEHFRQITRHKIGGKAKAMVVTASRLHAVRYKQEFDRYIKEKNYNDIKTLVAFSGTVKDEFSQEYTETGMNQFSEHELPKKFASDEFQILIVAEKYQTGFDQPLLHTMYVDKKLYDVKAVQTLSRLNRTHPGKEDTFVLDFVNEEEDIKKAFQPYYEMTTVDEVTDANLLYDYKYQLDNAQIYWQSEVDAFCNVFYKADFQQDNAKDQAMLNAHLAPALDRFNQAEKEKQEEFRDILSKFIRLYSFLSQIIPFQDVDLHKLHTFARFLIRKLPKIQSTDHFQLDDEVTLQYYRLQKISEGAIELEKNQEGVVKGSKAIGSKSKDEKAPLSKIIDILNERFGTNFTEADQLTMDAVEEDMVRDEELALQARSNTLENYKYAFEEIFIQKWIERMDSNQSLFAKIMDNEEFREVLMYEMMKKVYERQNEV